MNRSGQNFDPREDLLGLHLGLIDDASEAARVRAAFGNSQDFGSARVRLQRCLAPLDADAVEAPPPDLARRILDYVGSAEPATIPFPRKTVEVPAGESAPAGSAFMALRELVGLAAAILLFVGIFIPGYNSARQAAQKIACMNNLRSLGTGYSLYKETYGSWPSAGPVPDNASWRASADPATPSLRASRNVFPMVQQRYVPVSAFICPSRSNTVPFNPAALNQFSDFPDPRNNSYCINFTNHLFTGAAFQPATPLASDMNPRVDTIVAPVEGASIENSRSHGRLNGQNVLHANISVRWSGTPRAGVDGDDIYNIVGVQEPTGVERPSSPTDALLIP
jgi:hypothetical protein